MISAMHRLIRPRSAAIFVGSSLVLLLLARVLWIRSKRRKHNESMDRPPASWKRVGEVSRLVVYPLKSGRGIFLNEAECAFLGLIDVQNPHLQLRDREFVVYDPVKKKAVSGLVDPRMVLVGARALNKSTVQFSFPGVEDFNLAFPIDTSNVVVLDRWWGEQVSAVDCGNDVARWLSQALLSKTSGIRLGHFSQPTVPLRSVENGWIEFTKIYPRFRSEYLGAYSYVASYLIITEESVAEVNSRLSQPVSAQHYRANIVVRGMQAYSEDTWDWLRLGDTVVLRGFKPCTRCAVISINPETGKLDPKLEVLSTLKQYRQVEGAAERKLVGSEPVFGLHAGLHEPGRVKIGDPVYIGVVQN